MKQLFLLLLFMFSTCLYAQDVIVKKDGSTILSKVIEVGTSEIKYKNYSNMDGPIYTIPKSAVTAINYGNGEKVNYFNAEQTLKNMKSQNLLRWIGGGLLTSLGLYCLADLFFIDLLGVSETGSWILFGASLASVGGGSLLLYSAAKHQNRIKKMERQIQGVSFYEYDFNFSNGTSIALSADLIRDTKLNSKTIGLGLRYNF